MYHQYCHRLTADRVYRGCSQEGTTRGRCDLAIKSVRPSVLWLDISLGINFALSSGQAFWCAYLTPGRCTTCANLPELSVFGREARAKSWWLNPRERAAGQPGLIFELSGSIFGYSKTSN